MRYIYTNIFEQETRYAKDVPIRDKKTPIPCGWLFIVFT